MTVKWRVTLALPGAARAPRRFVVGGGGAALEQLDELGGKGAKVHEDGLLRAQLLELPLREGQAVVEEGVRLVRDLEVNQRVPAGVALRAPHWGGARVRGGGAVCLCSPAGGQRSPARMQRSAVQCSNAGRAPSRRR